MQQPTTVPSLLVYPLLLYNSSNILEIGHHFIIVVIVISRTNVQLEFFRSVVEGSFWIFFYLLESNEKNSK